MKSEFSKLLMWGQHHLLEDTERNASDLTIVGIQVHYGMFVRDIRFDGLTYIQGPQS